MDFSKTFELCELFLVQSVYIYSQVQV